MTDQDADQEEPGHRTPGRQPPPRQRPAEKAASPDTDTRLAVSIEPRSVRVDPGGGGSVIIRVRNTGSVVDEISFEILGDAAGWSSVVPSELRLFPGTEGTAVVTLRPPRAPLPNAGSLEVRVALGSRERPAASAEASLRLEIAPFDDLTATLSPRYGSARREFTTAVKVANLGNRAVGVRIGASDPQHGLDFSVQPEQVPTAPGSEATAWLRIRPLRSPLFGRAHTYPFEVAINPVPGSSRTLDGRLDVVPLLPTWVALIGALLLVLALAGGVACGTGLAQCLPAASTPAPGVTPAVPATAPPPTATPPAVTATPPAVTATPPVNLRVVPNVAGLPLNEASVILQRAGFTVFPRDVADSGLDVFTVIRTEPAAGESVAAGSDVRVFFAFP